MTGFGAHVKVFASELRANFCKVKWHTHNFMEENNFFNYSLFICQNFMTFTEDSICPKFGGKIFYVHLPISFIFPSFFLNHIKNKCLAMMCKLQW